MFWLVYLPVALFVIILISGIISAIVEKDLNDVGGSIGLGVIVLVASMLIGFFINLFVTTGFPSTSVPDNDNPVYLVSLTGDEYISGGFILAFGSVGTDETYRYHYYLPGTEKIASGSIKASKALIIEDSPDRPYYVLINAVCPERSDFWIINECNYWIPYTIEFHVPEKSVIQQFQVNP